MFSWFNVLFSLPNDLQNHLGLGFIQPIPKSYYMTAQLACLAVLGRVTDGNFLVKWFENTSTLPPNGKVFFLANMRIVAPFKEITATLNKHAPVA